jgi:hypothetical protein
MKNDSRISLSVSMPSSWAVSASSATARSPLPVRVLLMSRVRPTTMTIDTKKITTCTVRMRAGPKLIEPGRSPRGSW